MAQSITLLGATYNAVPAVDLPKTGGGTARFTDVTPTTAVASDVTSGKIFFKSDGTQDTGTNQGGGGASIQIGLAHAVLGSASSSITFTGLLGEPTSFCINAGFDLATGASPWKTAFVVYDGNDVIGQTITNTNNAQVSYDGSGFSMSYSNGTLTVTGTGANFQTGDYYLTYTYGGTAGNIYTEDVQVGSGAMSITFTGLEDEPIYWSLIFKSDFGSSSGYQRVIGVVSDGSGDIYGLAMDSSAHYNGTYWTASYSNGSLTITSQGTNAGGYFHQPGYYQLTYAIGEVEPPTIEPLNVTQNGTYRESGKAYSPVTVNVSGGGSWNVGQETWNNNSTSTVSHQFTGLSGTPKAAILRCTSQLTRSSSNTYYYIADIIWDGTDAWGNYHLRSNGTFNNVAKNAASGFNVSVGTNSITFSSDATSRSSAPGSFYNGTYELTYWY